jgi:hypothetical protein
MLSLLSDPKGVALNRTAIITNDKSPFRERWGGWYVTGTHGNQRHMGNSVIRLPASALGKIQDYARQANLNEGANITDLKARFDPNEYLIPDSDIAALMVLGHQTHLHNLLIVAHYNLRAGVTEALVKEYAEPLVKTLLFVDAEPLTDPVKGTTQFAEEFSARGPRDKQGRSLYELDLKRRLLRYPLSYLIYSKSFAAVPQAAREYVYRRLWEILNGKDTSAEFAHLSAEDRKAILEILLDTKSEFADFAKKLG